MINQSMDSNDRKQQMQQPLRLQSIFTPLILNYVVSFLVQMVFLVVIVMGVMTDYVAQSPELKELITSESFVTVESVEEIMTDEVLEELTMEMLEILENNIALLTVCAALACIPMFGWMMYRDKKKREVYENQEKIGLPILYYGFIIVGSITLCIVLNNLTTLSQLAEVSQNYQESSEALYSFGFAGQLLAWGVVAPISEELLFRGVIYKRLRISVTPVRAIFWSALIFGCYHGNIVQLIYAFFCGMMLAWVYEKYGTIKAPMLGHICINLTALVLTQYDLFVWMFQSPIRMTVITVLSASLTATIYVMLQNLTRENQEAP